jgi:hypothetical protein
MSSFPIRLTSLPDSSQPYPVLPPPVPFATNHQSLALNPSPSLCPHSADSAGNPSDGAATLPQQHVELRAANSAVHRISALALASSATLGPVSVHSARSRSASIPHSKASVEPGLFPSTVHRIFWSLQQPCFPLFAPRCQCHSRRSLSPIRDRWASVVKMSKKSLFLTFQRSSTENTNATGRGRTADLTSAKLNDLRGGGNVPRLQGPETLGRPSEGHIHDNSSSSTAVSNGMTNKLCVQRRQRSHLRSTCARRRSCPKYVFERQWQPAEWRRR